MPTVPPLLALCTVCLARRACARLESSDPRRLPMGCSVSRKYSALLMNGGFRRAGAYVINTHMSYKQVTRDMARSMERVENQPLVKRDTEYFLANIGKVTNA